MSQWGNVNFEGLKELTENVQRAAEESEQIAIACLKEIAARLLSGVIDRTPTGEYSSTVEFIANIPKQEVSFTTKSGKNVNFTAKARQKKVSFRTKTGKNGGTLRRGWTANKLDVTKNGDMYSIVIQNDTPYASYVENGHRTANKKGWVEGKYMLRISEKEIKNQAPSVIEKKIEAMLKEVMGK